jgi:hypothetical protein
MCRRAEVRAGAPAGGCAGWREFVLMRLLTEVREFVLMRRRAAVPVGDRA